MTYPAEIVRDVLKALQDDWMLVEDLENDGCMILVDENRDEMQGLRPTRELVAWMVERDLLSNKGVPVDSPPIYGEFTVTARDGTTTIHQMRDPHVYEVAPTARGLAFLAGGVDGD